MSRDDEVFDELKSHQTQDALLTRVIASSWDILSKSSRVNSLEEPALYVVDFKAASPNLRQSDYYTPASQALLIKNAIIVNQDFLFEMESALRSFELSDTLLDCQYIQGEEEMYGLIERIRSSGDRYLNRLRLFWANNKSYSEEDIVEGMKNIALFVIGHEIGHLLDRVEQRSFGTFIQQNTALEDKIDNAVIKLCRHVDEFARLGFDLGGFQELQQVKSDVRKTELELRKKNEVQYERHSQFFKDEDSADETTTDIILEYLGETTQHEGIEAEYQQYVLFKALFVAAVYSWYKDLLTFSEKLGIGRLVDSRMLSIGMMKNRDQYIRAASLFGEVHRFTLLRAFLAMKVWLEKRTSFYDPDAKERSIWFDTHKRKADMSLNERKRWWLSECLQRHMLLGRLMDTAVKLAYVGGATAWIKGADIRRSTPQLFVLQFFSLRQELDALRRYR